VAGSLPSMYPRRIEGASKPPGVEYRRTAAVPVKLAVFLFHTLKGDSGDRSGGNSVFQLEGSATSGDRRYTARSARHAENDGIPLFLDFFPEIRRVVSKYESCLAFQHRFDRRHVFGKPCPELFHEEVASPKPWLTM